MTSQDRYRVNGLISLVITTFVGAQDLYLTRHLLLVNAKS